LTYAGLRRSTRVWADCLDRAGIPPGGHVAVRLPDPLSYATALVSILAGRSDDVINRGGQKIYPREIEDFLLTQPGVRSAAVVGAHDEVLGERPVAYVVPAGPGRWREMEDALRAACEAALPRPKRPSAFCLVRELPLGPTGKVARHRLRDAHASFSARIPASR
jgi:acyl-CoA synthetase (AMP-forming)/AMP-acid ligase II